MSNSDKRSKGVQSMEIGLSILDVLIDQREPMKLKNIALSMQMHPAKMHRYLVSLIRKKYVEQLGDGSYALGIRVDALRQAGLNQNNVMEQLIKIATDIKDSLYCGVQIAKWFNEGPIVIKAIEPDTPISIITRVGSRMPLVTSATGQLLASYQPLDTIKPLVLAELQSTIKASVSTVFEEEGTQVETRTQEIEKQWQQYEQSLHEIREQGYSCVTGDMMRGINAFSIPIDMQYALDDSDALAVSNNRQLGHSITVIGTAEQLPYSKKKSIINQMLSISQSYIRP